MLQFSKYARKGRRHHETGCGYDDDNSSTGSEFARQLSSVDQRWVALHLQEHLELTLPDQATLDEAVELYLADACSLGRAAELAGLTRWDMLDALKARDAMQRPVDFRSADEMDDLPERLEQQSML